MSAALYDAQLREIVEAVTMTAAGSADVATLGGMVQTVAVANERGPFLGLAEMLYATRYNVPRTPVEDAADVDAEEFLRALRAANVLRQRYDRGAPVPRETITSQYGHYVLLGQPMHDARTGRQVRFYWNLSLGGATAFVREIGARFERTRIPFQAKLPVHPRGFARTDTGVLYLGDEDVSAATDPIRGAHAALRPFLRAEAPMFALPLAPGLSFAESPSNGDSFGLHRCDLIAEGLVRAFERGATETDARLAAVRERLTRYGLDLERFAFNPLSRYPYGLDALAEAA